MNIQVAQLVGKLQEMFEKHIDNTDLSAHRGENLSDHIQSRCIAAFAVYWAANCSIEEAAQAVTDCSHDNGIDALFFNEKNNRLIIVQSKLIKNGSSEPSSSEVKDFRSGIYDLIEGRLHKFGEKVTNKKSEIGKIKSFGTKFDVILAHTSKDEIAQPSKDAINELLQDLNGEEEDDDPFCRFNILSKKRIVDSLMRAMGQGNIDIEFLLKDYGMLDDPVPAYYGKVAGSKLLEWWNKHNDLLFKDNIRKSLGTTPVNATISTTIAEKPELFWYYNNGITIICDEIQKTPENGNKRDFGIFKANNASIVNGAQTYSTIGKSGSKGINLDNVSVFLRVIETGTNNESLKSEITKYNNTQNSILPRDFISQDPVQINLQHQLALSGYSYVIKRDEAKLEGEKYINIENAIEALVITSSRPGFAALFRKEIGKFQNPDGSQYKTIFNDSTNAFLLINTRILSLKIDAIIPECVKEIRRENPELSKIESISESGSVLIKQIYFKNLASTVRKTMSENLMEHEVNAMALNAIILKMIKIINDDYKSNYIVTLFQNSEKCTAIYSQI